jgi:quercetin dioxygenase-like cupin family protein
MKALLTAVLIGSASVAFAGDVKKSGGAVFTPAPDIKWQDVPGMKGIQLAPLGSDPAKGPSHFFLKFAPGFSAPVHHHSAEHFVTVVSGTLVLTVDGTEQKLPAGSYFAFSKKKPHATRCEAGADCVLAMDVRGKWDVVPQK